MQVDYHFTTPEIIQKEIHKGNFIEHAVVHGNIYGTSFSSVEDVIHKNRICILDIDVQGVQNILKKVADATTILILPPSIEELSRRLHKRNTENEETIQLRLKNSIAEMEKASHIPFTKVIVNKDINDSYQELKQLAKVKLQPDMQYEQAADGEWHAVIKLENTTSTPALMVRLNIVGDQDGLQFLPIFYSDNYFALMPGEKKEVRVHWKDVDTRGNAPVLKVTGYNVE